MIISFPFLCIRIIVISTHILSEKGNFLFCSTRETYHFAPTSFRETPLLDELRKQGKIELHFLREGLIVNQQSNSAQLLQWDVGVLFASSYVRQLSDNVKRSQEQCIKNGQWVFSRPPYGYKNITLPTGKKDIQIDPDKAAFVIKVFELYAKSNNSFQTIAITMKNQGFTKSSRGKSITARTIELILKNPFYMGMMRIKNRLHPHNYQPLVNEELFNTVQGIIANHHKRPIHYAGKPILLRGLISCANCKGTVSGDIKKNKYVYYSCHNSKRICTKQWVREEKLLDSILHHFDAIQLNNTQINDIIHEIESDEIQQQETTRFMHHQLNQKLNLTQERISKLIDMHIDGTIDSQSYHFKLEEYRQEQQRLTLEIKSYETGNKAELVAAKDILYLAKNAKEIFISSKLEEKQQLLGFLFSNLRLNNELLDAELREPFNHIANIHDQHIWRG